MKIFSLICLIIFVMSLFGSAVQADAGKWKALTSGEPTTREDSKNVVVVHGSDMTHTDFWHPEDFSTQSRLNILYLSGKNPEQIGKALAKVQSGGEYGEISDEARQLASKSIANIKKIAPQYLRILEARAATLKINLVDSIAEGVHSGIAFDEKVVADIGCSTVALTTGIVGQTLDEPLKFANPNKTLVVMDDFIGMYNNGALFQGMGRHVGAVFNYLGSFFGPGERGDNFTNFDAIIYAMTQAKNVDEALEIAKRYRSEIAQTITIADDKGNVASIEVSKDTFLVDRGNGRGVAHTNHGSIDGRGIKTFGVTEDNYREVNQKTGWTFARKDYLDFWLKYTPELDVDAMKYLFSVRPINLSPYKGDIFATVQTMIWDVKNGCAHVTSDNPRFVDYEKVCFTK